MIERGRADGRRSRPVACDPGRPRRPPRRAPTVAVQTRRWHGRPATRHGHPSQERAGRTLARATVGRARGDAIISLSHAYRNWALKHPGRYAAAQRVPAPGDTEAEAADWASVEIIGDILAGYDLRGDDAIDATRVLRAALHGFVTLEATFVHPADIDRSFDRLVQGLTTALAGWTDQPARTDSGN